MERKLKLEPGQIILNGKYRVLKFIDEGGMAHIWLAEELTFGGRQVAIKEPRDDLLLDDLAELRQRFQREVRVSALLTQAKVPHIVHAITAEPYGEGLLLILTYMPGGSLSTLLKRHPQGLSVKRALQIAIEVLEALEGLHRHELAIVHRDIKPSNILFDSQGVAHLGDFGLAQVSGMSEGRTRLRGGAHPGTPLYMAPEQGRGGGYLSPAADLYALGCVLFEVVTGQHYKHLRPGTKSSSLRAGVPEWLDELLAKALAEDPWDRWQSAAAMAAVLENALAEGEQAARREEVARHQQTRVQIKTEEHARKGEDFSGQGPEISQRVEFLGDKVKDRTGKDMVLVPAGEFIMGEGKNRRQAWGASFYVDRYPVTNQEYQQFIHGVKKAAFENFEAPSPERGYDVLSFGQFFLDTDWEPQTPPPDWDSDDWQAWQQIYNRLQAVDDTARKLNEEESKSELIELGLAGLGALLSSRKKDEDALDRSPDLFRPRRRQRLSWRTDTLRKWVREHLYLPFGWNIPSLSYPSGQGHHPVTGITWQDAVAYCKWRGEVNDKEVRLPTEEEWEKAARGTDGRRYPWGDAFDSSRCNWKGSEHNGTTPVDAHSSGVSPYGVMDMVGNVWEYTNTTSSGWLDIIMKRVVLKGGSWKDDYETVHCASRRLLERDTIGNDTGFRCVMPIDTAKTT